MTIKCAEFFSGLGGMHFALEDAGLGEKVDVIRAFDINTVANEVYKENFGIEPVVVNVEHCPLEYYEKMDADAWLMSPPCQPFTRGGNMHDAEDKRSTGFIHLMKILEKMKNPPKYLFLENVLNFEVSECHKMLVEILEKVGYEIEEFLVDPTDPWVNIPNARLRYYLAAVRKENETSLYTQNIYKSFDKVFGPLPADVKPKKIGEFLDADANREQFLVPELYLRNNKFYRHDIVDHRSSRSATFTKAYGSKHIIGTGSVLQTKNFDLEFRNDDVEALLTIGLSFFTPMEIAKLHGLPTEAGTGSRIFKFAKTTTKSQQYKMLGNSLNVKVVSMIFKRLFRDL